MKMNRTIVNLGAIVVAFVIGLAINNACADSLENMSDSQLRNLVAELQKEVNSLKQRVAELEGKVGNSNTGNGASVTPDGFEVDGIHFSHSGFPDSKVDYMDYSGYYYSGGTKYDQTPTTTRYEYDSKGRIIKQGVYIYTYSNKAYSQAYAVEGDTETGYSQYLKYVYHLK